MSMIASPWDIILTAVFAFTGAVCLGHLIAHRARGLDDRSELSRGELVDINHGVMSLGMILMIWVSVQDVVTWAEIALFAILALSLLPGFRSRTSATLRIDIIGHIFLDLAMIWMLAAMPLLMAGMGMRSGGHAGHEGHGGGGEGEMLAATPEWADLVNSAFVVVCAVAALWWIYRVSTSPGHRLHATCHAVMAAGMGVMLVLMNL